MQQPHHDHEPRRPAPNGRGQARTADQSRTEMLAQRARETLTPDRGDRRNPTRGLPSTAAIAGHPIHPMLIPFPIAFLTGAVATDLVARATRDPFWARSSKVLLGAGIASGLLAGAVGAIDYFTIRRAREKPVGKIHAYGNPLALALAAANLATRKDNRAPDDTGVALSLATAAVLGVTGWAGGELSYTHMVGVAGHDDQHTEEEKRYVP